MTTATIGATAAAHTGLKIATGCLAAALTAGGAAAATGNLPAGAQRFAADAAVHLGIRLPQPSAEVGLDLSGDTWASQMIPVGTAGQIGVVLDSDGLNLTTVDANAGFTAKVIAETADTIIVEFRSGGAVSSVLVSDVNRTITSSVTGAASLDTGGNADGTGSAGADANAGTDGSAGIGESAHASTSIGIDLTPGG